MLTLATISFALLAGAHPLHSSLSGLTSHTAIGARTSCTDGAILCNGQSQFGLCNHGSVIFQAVAPGTVCENGAILQAGIQDSAPAAAASIVSTAQAAPSPVPSPYTSSSTVTVTTLVYSTTYVTPQSTPTTTSPAPETPSASTPAPESSSASTPAPSTGDYQMHTGDGSVSSGWPVQADFASFDSLWAANVPAMSSSCAQFSQANNSPQEIADIKTAIQSAAQNTGVLPQFLLAIMMQESKGCVRVWSTSYSVVNPGLFQSHSGTGTCNAGTQTIPGQVSNPCPAGEIQQMVTDGASGTAAGPGLQQAITQAGGTDGSQFYKAARIYNSGSIAASGDLGQGVATHCYASDIANRLTGRLTGGPTGCTLDS